MYHRGITVVTCMLGTRSIVQSSCGPEPDRLEPDVDPLRLLGVFPRERLLLGRELPLLVPLALLPGLDRDVGLDLPHLLLLKVGRHLHAERSRHPRTWTAERAR